MAPEHTDGDRTVELDVPEDSWWLLALLTEPHRFAIRKIYSRATSATVAAVSTQRLHNIAGEYVGKDDPVAIGRTQKDFPPPGEVVQPYGTPPYVAGAIAGRTRRPLLRPERRVGEPPTTTARRW
jgi:fructose 1,6-bisphosphate aldolase/phosphatase